MYLQVKLNFDQFSRKSLFFLPELNNLQNEMPQINQYNFDRPVVLNGKFKFYRKNWQFQRLTKQTGQPKGSRWLKKDNKQQSLYRTFVRLSQADIYLFKLSTTVLEYRSSERFCDVADVTVCTEFEQLNTHWVETVAYDSR